MRTATMRNSKRLWGSICVSDIDKSKLIKSEKSGKLYLPVVLWLDDQADQYGNVMAMQISQTKEERDKKIKAVYLGNFRLADDLKPTKEDTDDLPF